MMRGLIGSVLFGLLAGGIGVGLFVVKHEVKEQESRLRELNSEIQHNQEAIHVLKAEWSYLNDPGRLRHLSEKFLSMKVMGASQVVDIRSLQKQPMVAAAQPLKAPPAVVKTAEQPPKADSAKPETGKPATSPALAPAAIPALAQKPDPAQKPEPPARSKPELARKAEPAHKLELAHKQDPARNKAAPVLAQKALANKNGSMAALVASAQSTKTAQAAKQPPAAAPANSKPMLAAARPVPVPALPPAAAKNAPAPVPAQPSRTIVVTSPALAETPALPGETR